MKTEDIEYNGQIFSCHKIIDISAMIELLSLLAKKQEYLEKKIDFQEERINDKDKRISELEIIVKGFSLSKDEKFPSEKEVKDNLHDDDDDLDEYLKEDNKQPEEKNLENNYINDVKEIKEEKKYESKKEDLKQDLQNDDINLDDSDNDKKDDNNNNNVKKEEKKEDIKEEKKEEKKEDKIEEIKEDKKDDYNYNNNNDISDKKESKERTENKENEEKKETIENKDKEKNEEIKENKTIDEAKEEKKININIIPSSSPIEIKNKNYSNQENTQTINSSPSEKKTISQAGSSNTSPRDEEILKKIIKKLKLLDSKIEKLEQNEAAMKPQIIQPEKTNKSKLEGRINLLINKFDELEDNEKKMKEDINKLKLKVEDFNVYDIIKGTDSGDGNVDIAKGLIMNLENKIFKKLGFYDAKFKKNEEDILKNKNDITNLNNIISSIKEKNDILEKSISNMKNNDDEKYSEINKYIKEVNTKIKDIDNKVKFNNNGIKQAPVIINNNNNNNNLNNDNNNNNHIILNNNNNERDLLIDEMKEKIDELEEKINDMKKSIDILNNSKALNEQNQEFARLIKELSSRINELEKKMKTILDEMNIKEIYERLDTLEKDLFKKSNKYETNEINEKISNIEENDKDLSYKLDTLQQFSEKIRGDNQQIVKKIEFLSGQINRISIENIESDKSKGPIIDINKFVDFNSFNEKNKEINKKFDKIRLSFEEIARNMDDILQKLSHVPTDADFAQFQSIIKNTIEELKLTLNKKYAEKNETNKNMKFIETQIKTIQESFQKKLDGADNWLLAKKPLNNYVCASCESIIKGELDKKSEFVPWNKYPNREEKSYRFGHGFSRMLQLINEDRKKELKDKESISDEERSRGGSDSEPMFKLPKLKRNHINSGKLKINMGMLNYEEDKPNSNNVPFDKGRASNNEIEQIYSEDRPKIMKIFKRNKNVVQSVNLNKGDKINNKDNLSSLITKTIPAIQNNPINYNNKEGNQIVQTENNINNNEE